MKHLPLALALVFLAGYAAADSLGYSPYGLVEDYISGSGVASGNIDLNGNLLYDSGDQADLGTACTDGHSQGTGAVCVGGSLQVDGMLWGDAGTIVSGAALDVQGQMITEGDGTYSWGHSPSGIATEGSIEVDGAAHFDGNVTNYAQLSHDTNTVTCATATDDFDINWNNGNVAFFDMEDCDQDANDVNAPTNPVEGSSYAIVIEQSTAGTEDLTWNAVFLFAGGTDPALTQSNNARDIVSCLYVDSIYHCSFVQNVQ